MALLLGGIVAINPNTNQAYADGGNENGNNTNAEVTPLAGSSISLAFDGTPSFTEEVNADEVAYITNTFTVTAKKQAKFTLQMTAMNGSGTNLHGKENTAATIGGVGENVAPASFANNTWGYALTNNTGGDQLATAQSLTYSSMPNYGTPKNVITENLTGAENETKSYLLAFAAKIGSDSPADHYIGNFLLSVVGDQFDPATYTLTYDPNNGTGAPSSQSCEQASVGATCDITIAAGTPSRDGFTFLGWGDDPADTVAKYSAGSVIPMSANKTIYAVWKSNATFATITTMQEMTKDVCASASEHQAKQLTDTRDSKTYWVTKLKDGNCWMTQNLDYDGWGIATTVANWPGSGTAANYYNPDPYYYNGVIAEGFAIPTQYPEACPTNAEGLSNCTSYGFSLTPGKNINEHYLIGNYYSWSAATTTSGGAGQDANSICPSGWQLPTSNNTNSKSFGGLMNAYGINGSTNLSRIYSAPLCFVYGGNLYDGKLYNAGYYGGYWSSTPVSNGTDAYNLYFGSSVNSSNNNYSRSDGFFVRCVAK